MSGQSAWTFREGTLVRSTNALYCSYGIGRIQKVRGGQAKVEFNPSVFMQPPYRSENKILHLVEMQKVDSPLDRALRSEWEEPWCFELRMQAARFLTGNKGGQLSNARTEILPHQIFAAHRVVSSPRRRFLLADEVGLGKTIEAGMIWQALAQHGHPKLRGRSGFLFLFVVRQRIAHEGGDECLFQFRPVFVRADGQIDPEAVGPAVTETAREDSSASGKVPSPEPAFRLAQQHLERETGIWDWADDVEFLGVSWVQFQ